MSLVQTSAEVSIKPKGCKLKRTALSKKEPKLKKSIKKIIATGSTTTPVKVEREILLNNNSSLITNLVPLHNEIKDETFTLTYGCEWKNCHKEYAAKRDFYEHIATHMNGFDIVDEKYICLWGPCIFTTLCRDEISRHHYYHAYQRVLTSIGDHECAKIHVPLCTLNPDNRNLLPDLRNDFRCRWDETCDERFKSIEAFHRHVAYHASFDYEFSKAYAINVDKLKFICKWENCNKVFHLKYRLVEHTRKHSNESLAGCSHCGSLFRSKTILFDHRRRQVANNTHQYQCSQCFKYFASEKLHRLHVIVHVNCYKCTHCDMSCNSASALATHFRYRHLKDKPFQCTKCKYTCVSKSDLDRHENQVHRKKLYQCGEVGCSYTIKSLNLFRRHYANVHSHNPAIYICHCCDKAYKRGKILSNHLIKKHDFQLPSGHKRFTFRLDEDGYYRVETTRIESLEVTKQILSPNPFAPTPDLPPDCYEIASIPVHMAVENSSDFTMNSNDMKMKAEYDNHSNDLIISILESLS